jgi:hypothetical protein
MYCQTEPFGYAQDKLKVEVFINITLRLLVYPERSRRAQSDNLKLMRQPLLQKVFDTEFALLYRYNYDS